MRIMVRISVRQFQEWIQDTTDFKGSTEFFFCPNTDHVTIPRRVEPLSCSLKRRAWEHENVQL